MLASLARTLVFGAAVCALCPVAACHSPEENLSDAPSAPPRNNAVAGKQAAESLASRPENDIFVCGGETTRSAVDRYYQDIAKALAEPDADRLFNHLVSRNLSLRDAHGSIVRLDSSEIETVTPRIVSRQDWQVISSRGPDALQDAGWRGCFLNHGKVWFEASEEDGLRLKSIARDMPWDGVTGK